MNCKYIYNGNEYDYELLVSELSKLKNRAKLLDILYSRDTSLQERIIDKLNEIQSHNLRTGVSIFKSPKKIKDQTPSNFLEGSAELKVGNDKYTILQYIDSPSYSNANKNLLAYDENALMEHYKEIYKSQGLSNEDITKKVDLIKKAYHQIAKDCSDFHRIVQNYVVNNTRSNIVDAVEDTNFTKFVDRILQEGGLGSQILKKVNIKTGKYSHEVGDDTKIDKRNNIIMEAESFTGDKIVAHFDFIAIHPDGTVEIFDIKGSHEDPSQWDQAKWEKYQNECAIKARILEYNGIPINNIRFNILPVILKYNDNFSEITDVKVNDPICLSHNKGAFILHDEFTYASRHIQTNVEELDIKDEQVSKVNSQLNVLFPESGIYAQGVLASVKDYIDSNWASWLEVELPSDGGYILSINGTLHRIQSSEKGSKNAEVVKLITDLKDELLNVNGGVRSASSVVHDIKDMRRHGGLVTFDDPYLNESLAKYFEGESIEDENGKKKINYIWNILDNPVLNNCNIIAFLNSVTNQIDIISLSPLDLDKNFKLSHLDNILGYHITDMQASTEDGQELLRATYGNLELIRSMYLLNEIIPDLPELSLLGDIKVIGGFGTHTHGVTYPIEMIFPHFFKCVEVHQSKNNESVQLNNNFENIDFIDPTLLLINEFYQIQKENPTVAESTMDVWKEILSGSNTDGLRHLIDGSEENSLATAEQHEVKIKKMEEFINSLLNYLRGGRAASGKYIKGEATNDAHIFYLASKYNPNSKNNDIKIIAAKLLTEASVLLNRMEGNARIRLSDFSDVDSIIARPQNMEDGNTRVASKLVFDAIHLVLKQIDPILTRVNNIFQDYYLKKGYGSLQNGVIGNMSDVFQNLFIDDDYELILKNPYISLPNLDDTDREFLKKVLFEFAKFKYPDSKFPFKSYTDAGVKEFSEKNSDYFWAPLEKASQSTRISNPQAMFENMKRRINDWVHNPKQFFGEMWENILPEEREEYDKAIENLQAYNKFNRSSIANGRQNMIGSGENKRKRTFWESNLQNLFIDFVTANIRAKEMNKMLIRGRGIQLSLRMAGIDANDSDKFVKHIKRVDDYIKTAVLNKNIMTKTGKQLSGNLQILRKGLSYFNLAGNTVGGVRDLIGGFRSNLVRAITKYQTDIGASDILWAYGKVIGNGVHSPMDVDLLDRFNTRYLISNINREQQQRGYKKNQYGITNPSNVAFYTLSGPDYINRMTLFLAKLHKDGSFGAYSVGEDGELKYNWRKDKRFDKLANNDHSNEEEYKKLKSLYLSLILAFKNEGYTDLLFTDDLPDGYTSNQIESIKLLSDTIYGSYDNATKSGLDFTAAGSQLGVFSTWMNGIYDAYFGKRRQSSFETKKLQRTKNGKPLFFDEEYNITTEDTGVPVLDDVPLIVLGVSRTLLDIGNELLHGNGIAGINKNIIHDEMQMRNLRRLFSDIIMWLIFALVASQVKNAYKEHKKNDDGKNLMANLILEHLYKGYYASAEEMKGPWPIIDYVSNNAGAASIKWGTNIVSNVNGFVFGDKTLWETGANSIAFLRGAKDTVSMYKRDTQLV